MRKIKIPHLNLQISRSPYISLQDTPEFIDNQYENAELTFDDNGILYIKADQRIMRKEYIGDTIKKYGNITGKLKRKHLKTLQIRKTFMEGFIIPKDILGDMQNELKFIHRKKLVTRGSKQVYTFDDDSRIVSGKVYYVKELKPVEYMFSQYRICDEREQKTLIPAERTLV